MNRSNKISVRRSVSGTTWCWRQWISSAEQDLWIERLRAAGGLSWALTERPDRARILLEAYGENRSAVISLMREFGGQGRAVNAREWIGARPGPPLRIGSRLQIIHDRTGAGKDPDVPRLHLPHGVAFGSGEHATTRMLLHALARHRGWSETDLLDLGTGSGILALAARRFGARKIVATDFDAEAVRTGRQNEARNFSTPLIRWQCADVTRLRVTARYGLVVANLFSGILCDAAPQISDAVSPDGLLWLSGVLRSQEEEVIAAYRGRRLRLVRTARRGKWVMLQWARRRVSDL